VLAAGHRVTRRSVVEFVDPDTPINWRHENEEGHNDTCRRNHVFVFVTGLDIDGKTGRALGDEFNEPVVHSVTD